MDFVKEKIQSRSVPIAPVACMADSKTGVTAVRQFPSTVGLSVEAWLQCHCPLGTSWLQSIPPPPDHDTVVVDIYTAPTGVMWSTVMLRGVCHQALTTFRAFDIDQVLQLLLY